MPIEIQPVPIDLSLKEVKTILMGLKDLIETMSIIPPNFNAEAQWLANDIVLSAKSAMEKMSAATGVKAEIPPYKPGDEDEFLINKSNIN